MNLMIHQTQQQPPVIYARDLTWRSLFGAINYVTEQGSVYSNHHLLEPGLLREANGGYLVVHAKDILNATYAWMGLKRCLLTKEINIEALGKQMGLMVATTLRPQPIPLDVKLIIIGDAYTYYLLYQYDEDFRKLFKITAEFDMEMPRNEENIRLLARFIAAHCEKDNLRPFERNAVAKIIE